MWRTPQLMQALLKGFVGVLLSWTLRTPGEQSYTIDFPRLRRLAGKWRHEDGEGEGGEELP
jgi:hypothetical protein